MRSRARATVLATSLYSIVSATTTAARSPVYASGPSVSTTEQISHEVPSISWGNAQLYFADRLGVADGYSLDGADDATLTLLNQAQGSQQRLFAALPKDTRRTLVIVEGIQDPEAFFANALRPQFYIDQAPTMSESLHMTSTLLEQDRERRGATEACGSWITTADIKDSIQGGFSLPDPFGTCEFDNIQSESWWRSLSTPAKFDLLSAPASSLTKMYGQKVSTSSANVATSVFHIWTLHELATHDGVSSAAYRDTAAALKQSLLQLSASSADATIVLVPFTSGSSVPQRRDASALSKRADRIIDIAAAASTSPSETTTFPKTTIPRCYSSEDACSAATNQCSSHGACKLQWVEKEGEESASECWACVCVPSVLVEGTADGKGRKTIYWGGAACQKEDISVQFWLFAGFAVLMAGILSYGIGMLYSIGEAELPSVLGAGVGGPRPK